MYRIACLRIPQLLTAGKSKTNAKQIPKDFISRLITCSPKVTVIQPGLFLLDASGLKHFGGEPKFCHNLLRTMSQAGLTDSHLGLADSAFAAIVASRVHKKRFHIVAPQKDAEFLAPLSIKHLELSLDMQEALSVLGVKTMGQLTKISSHLLVERFGPEALRAYDLAKGYDKRKPQLPKVIPQFSCTLELASPITNVPEYLFILKSMLDKLVDDLNCANLAAEELSLSLYSNNDKFDERKIELISPSNKVKFLLEVSKLSLEAKPAERECTGLTLRISRTTRQEWKQMRLNKNAGTRFPNQMLVSEEGGETPPLRHVMQRFLTRLGKNVLVQAKANDQYSLTEAAFWVPIYEATPHLVQPNNTYIEETIGLDQLTTQLACKKLDPAVSVLIEFANSQPRSLLYNQKWYQVKQITVPDCLSSKWWDEPIRKSYHMALIQLVQKTTYSQASAELVLLVCDHASDSWFIEGIFD
jgi:nucleotidyltransferase/DNA polymerase involved in DNA repair